MAARSLRCVVVSSLLLGCADDGGNDEVSAETETGGESESGAEDPSESSSTDDASASESSSDDASETAGDSSTDDASSSETAGETGSETGSESSAESSGESSTGEPGECPDQELDGPLPITVMGDNTGAGDDFASCGEAGGADVSYAFVAPEQGTYLIDTFGSTFDTVLSVSEGLCQQVEPILCNDDAAEDSSSAVQVELEAGQQVTIHVDGFDGQASGSFTLHIDLDDFICPTPSDLGAVFPHQEQGVLDAGEGEILGSCGGAGNELAFQWTAPADGLYTLDTFGSAFDTVLYVQDSPCGAELACNDDAADLLQSQVQIMLAAGQTIVIVLDSFAPDEGGSFTLNIAGA